jgi:hypothetical protein
VNRSAGVEAAEGAGAAVAADGADLAAVERAVAAAARTAVDAAAEEPVDDVRADVDAADGVAADALAEVDALGAVDAIGGRTEATADDPAVGMLVAAVEAVVAAEVEAEVEAEDAVRTSFGSELEAPARTGQFGHRGAGGLVGALVGRADGAEVVVEALRAAAVGVATDGDVDGVADGVAEGTELPAVEAVAVAVEGAVSAGRRARAAAGVRTTAVDDAVRTAAAGGAWKVGQFGQRDVLEAADAAGAAGVAGVAGVVVLRTGAGLAEAEPADGTAAAAEVAASTVAGSGEVRRSTAALVPGLDVDVARALEGAAGIAVSGIDGWDRGAEVGVAPGRTGPPAAPAGGPAGVEGTGTGTAGAPGEACLGSRRSGAR